AAPGAPVRARRLPGLRPVRLLGLRLRRAARHPPRRHARRHRPHGKRLTRPHPARRSDMTESAPAPQIHKGLAGVVVDTTSVSSVNPETNSLLYRGYPVQELAARCSFEQVTWLLWHGELPSAEELATFQERERSLRAMPDDVRAAVDATPLHAHP